MKKSHGFTLIELLIVIALLGALAVGLLAALDPFEQLKKGTDTGVRNTVSEIHGAIIRHYANTTAMPYNGSTLAWQTATSAYTNVISPIVAGGELKQDFSTLAGKALDKIYLTGTDVSITVCFKPDSKSFNTDPNTKYDGSGNSTTGCKSQGGEGSCYWCVN